MTPQEANAVLGYCVGADSRLASGSEAEAAARTQVWADLLAAVDAQFALDHARRFYAAHHDWPLQPGAIRTAWTHHENATEARERVRALHAGGVRRPPISEDARQVIEDTRASVQAAAERGLPERRPVGPLRIARTEVFDGGAGHGQ